MQCKVYLIKVEHVLTTRRQGRRLDKPTHTVSNRTCLAKPTSDRPRHHTACNSKAVRFRSPKRTPLCMETSSSSRPALTRGAPATGFHMETPAKEDENICRVQHCIVAPTQLDGYCHMRFTFVLDSGRPIQRSRRAFKRKVIQATAGRNCVPGGDEQTIQS